MYTKKNNSFNLTKEMAEKEFELKTHVTGTQLESIIITAFEGATLALP